MLEKILLITKNYPPQIGGIEKYAFDLYNRLVKEGNTVYLIAAAPRNEWLLTRKGTGKGIASKFWKILYVVSELWRLGIFAIKCFTLGFFYSFRSDLIWSLDGSIGWIGVILGKSTGKKTRVTGHGRDIALNKRNYRRLLIFSLRNTDEIIAVSSTIRDLIMQLSIRASKIRIEEHSLSTLVLPESGVFDREEFLKKYNIPKDKILLLSVGRFVEKKGFHWFISEVLPSLNNQKFHYVLTGSGEMEGLYREIIVRKCIINITLTGPIKNPLEKARLYSSMNYFVMPNIPVKGDCEGYGLVLLEAQYYHLKALVANIDGLGDRVKETDIILKSGNAHMWHIFLENIV